MTCVEQDVRPPTIPYHYCPRDAACKSCTLYSFFCDSHHIIIARCNAVDVLYLVLVRWKMSAYRHFTRIAAVRQLTGIYIPVNWTACIWRNVFRWHTSCRRGYRRRTVMLCWTLYIAMTCHIHTAAWRTRQLCMWTASTTNTTSHSVVWNADTSTHHRVSAPVPRTRPTLAAVCPASCQGQRGRHCIFRHHLQRTPIRTLYWHRRATVCRIGTLPYTHVMPAKCWHSDRSAHLFIGWLMY